LRTEGENITSVWEYGEDRKKWVRYHYSLRKKRAPGVNVNKAATR
jgi:hypothetical protein